MGSGKRRGSRNRKVGDTIARAPAPPTIAHLKGHCLVGLFVVCANAACMHATASSFAALDLAEHVQFPSITRRRHFVCSRCGASFGLFSAVAQLGRQSGGPQSWPRGGLPNKKGPERRNTKPEPQLIADQATLLGLGLATLGLGLATA